ncbi:MAG: hypothetical protein ACP5RH_17145 [Leptodesmis sp.]
MDYAFDRGVNFIDTAEMYLVPAKAADRILPLAAILTEIDQVHQRSLNPAP